ncbi:unnamed protein product [Rotaria sordida]|uniref:Uncharacterized protein n=1 Tax=Rotaria sordida TaxID=392033 RepID=A0A815F669_9BILA|nr:unnamed protein product [Rotaria sordida]CAF1274458.1 unnamed protein product [Rotaria sordida]CAF1319220.1 unnamed protein product [Rotaria sordida]CAF1516239.1 unnamed protein product [Rotaria sordida]CAF3840436.1 unnamed protein product [Rotaria sordida]
MHSILSEKTIKPVCDKFIETGSMHDRGQSRRSFLVTSEKLDEIAKDLLNNSMNNVRRFIMYIIYTLQSQTQKYECMH